MDKTTIEVHESMLGPFARKQDAQAVTLALMERGWPVTYAEGAGDERPRWAFDTLAEYRRFMLDWETTVDELSQAGSFTVSWGCDCDEDLEPCPHGDDPVQQRPEPPLEELYGWALREALEKHYPGLRDWVEASVHCIYGALAFGLQLEEVVDVDSAAGQWLRREWHLKRFEGELRTYDAHIDDFARFVHFAANDAWFSEYLAKHHIDLDNVERCGRCGDLIGLGCRCGESAEA